MKALPTPTTHYRRDLQQILTAREWSRLGALVDKACAKARIYARRSPDLCGLATDASPAQKAFLVRLYEAERVGLTAVKRRILDGLDHHAQAICQYCGLDIPETFDHYLSKADVPELALYARNLVPCCYRCNNIRGPAFDRATNERRILHFFDDDLASFPMALQATLTFDDAGDPSVSYTTLDVPHRLAPVFRRHIDALRLADRFRIRALDRVSVLRSTFAGATLTVAALVSVLKAQKRAVEAARGPNNWEVALLTALLDSPQALAWLRAGRSRP